MCCPFSVGIPIDLVLTDSENLKRERLIEHPRKGQVSTHTYIRGLGRCSNDTTSMLGNYN